ncbi:MAG: hypothetical protein QM756_12330 [Polyangiaceae bacterium]
MNRAERRRLAHAIPLVPASAAEAAREISPHSFMSELKQQARAWDIDPNDLARLCLEAFEKGCLHCGEKRKVRLVLNRVAVRTAVACTICDRCLVAHGQPHVKGGTA